MPRPRVLCPECGHRFDAVRCQCRGHIISAESWKLGRWDWRWIFGSFRDGVRPSDIDAVVEKHGHFLIFETKAPGVESGRGQRLLLERLAKLPEFTVVTLWGEADATERMQVWGSDPVDADNAMVWAFAAAWWTSINRRGQARQRSA